MPVNISPRRSLDERILILQIRLLASLAECVDGGKAAKGMGERDRDGTWRQGLHFRGGDVNVVIKRGPMGAVGTEKLEFF